MLIIIKMRHAWIKVSQFEVINEVGTAEWRLCGV